MLRRLFCKRAAVFASRILESIPPHSSLKLRSARQRNLILSSSYAKATDGQWRCGFLRLVRQAHSTQLQDKTGPPAFSCRAIAPRRRPPPRRRGQFELFQLFRTKFDCAPARIRTWNDCFEGNYDIRFTTGAYRNVTTFCDTLQ